MSSPVPTHDSEGENPSLLDAIIPNNTEEESHEDLSEEPRPASPIIPVEHVAAPAAPAAGPSRKRRRYTRNPDHPHIIHPVGRRRNQRLPPTAPRDPNNVVIPDARHACRWITQGIGRWRSVEGNPFMPYNSRPAARATISARDFPITEEPPLHTITLLTARLLKQEDTILMMQRIMGGMPTADQVKRLEEENKYMGDTLFRMHRTFREIKARMDAQDKKIAGLEKKFDGVDAALEKFYTWERINQDMAAAHHKGASTS